MQRCPYMHEMHERLLGPTLPRPIIRNDNIRMSSFDRESECLLQSRPESRQILTMVKVSFKTSIILLWVLEISKFSLLKSQNLFWFWQILWIISILPVRKLFGGTCMPSKNHFCIHCRFFYKVPKQSKVKSDESI